MPRGIVAQARPTHAVAARVAKEAGREIALEDETCIAVGLEPVTTVKRPAGFPGGRVHLTCRFLASQQASARRWVGA
jgi:hypothetical protein